MPDKITRAVYEEAQKLVVRHQSYAHHLSESRKRRELRSGTPLPTNKEIKCPQYWACDKGFNPYHVRKQHESIARAIKKSSATGSYLPRPAVIHRIPKKGGGTRQISVFQVADQAISRLIFDRLMAKNASRLNPKCYAYRKDKTIHDAVLNLARDIKGTDRIYVAEYDFRDFFSSICHDQVEKVLSDPRFYLTAREVKTVMGFLKAPRLQPSSPSEDY
ncbi:MAG: reverse transcriptase domain-containing protein [Chloroflexi bacterium]|nr:reverse transcriptase domain-containing protein [Chloroflexota bacterium]